MIRQNSELFTALPHVRCLVWPRIPKTGGTNLLNALRLLIPNERLLITNAASAYWEDPDTHSFVPRERYNSDRLNDSDLAEFYEAVIREEWTQRNQWHHIVAAPLLVLQYHAPFRAVDLGDSLQLTPSEWKYVSMIRDPVDRIVSSFYYVRGQSGGWRAHNRSAYHRLYVPRILQLQRHFGVDECVADYAAGRNVCEFSTNYYVKWFCGADDACDPRMDVGERAYERAIENIDRYFAWIGVLEHYDESVFAFHRRFPAWFAHLDGGDAFQESFAQAERSLREQREQGGYGRYARPSESSYRVMRQMNAFDVRLYQYVLNKYGYM